MALTPIRRPAVPSASWRTTRPLRRPPGRGQADAGGRLCTLLGNILDLKRQDAQTVPWKPLLATLPSVAHDSRTAGGVRGAGAPRRRDPQRERARRRLGVSAGKLARDFKTEMGLSLVEYRNRLRLERFLALVDRGGGNLLQAALDAGFGSYAQFHRVFRSLLGTTPREYLTGRR
jgi:AraC-like DNA-binding protein